MFFKNKSWESCWEIGILILCWVGMNIGTHLLERNLSYVIKRHKSSILKGWMQMYCLISRHFSLCGRIKGHFYFLHLFNILKFSTHVLLLNENKVFKEKRHHSTQTYHVPWQLSVRNV